MKVFSLTVTFLFGVVLSVAWAADEPPTRPPVMGDLSVCSLYGYGECVSELRDTQVTSAPEWDISAGPPPLLPAKAEAIASNQIAAFVKLYPRLSFSHRRTRLIKRDAKHRYYGIEFTQSWAGTGSRPIIEVFVTFDGKVGSLTLTSPPKSK
jgi:hypothetical protein